MNHICSARSPWSRKSPTRQGSVTYSTFDPASTDVLRLDFTPESVTAGGKALTSHHDLSGEGYTFDGKTRVLRIHHTSSRDIDIQGRGGTTPPLYVTFDDPHQPAGTVLNGEYPSGVLDWADAQWQIGVPAGKFGTFNLVLKNPEAGSAEFRFAAPRIFLGFDVSNDGSAEAVITLRSDSAREQRFTIRPGELRRIRTSWRDPTTHVQFQIQNAQHLRFDNLAYAHP